MRVFVSYQNEDEASARHIGRQLSIRGHAVAFYPHKLDDPVSVITEELRRANLLLLTVGRNTHKSAWVSAEILAAQVLHVPLIATLLDEESRSPDTLPLNTPVAAYPSLIRTQFALFDIFPSHKMQSEQWKGLKVKVSPYQHPSKDTIPAPIIDRKSILNILLLTLGVLCAAASYLIGFTLPWLVYDIVRITKGWDVRGAMNPALITASFVIWWIILSLILFYKPRERLAYPLWILWFFKDYVPAWLSIRTGSATKKMTEVMRRLSCSAGNRAYWEEEQGRRTARLPQATGVQHTRALFKLLSKDERGAGPFGEFDKVGLSEIHEIIQNIPDFDIGRYGRSPVMIQRSPEEVEVFSPGCPVPYCLCGKSVRLRKVDDTWQIISKNW